MRAKHSCMIWLFLVFVLARPLAAQKAGDDDTVGLPVDGVFAGSSFDSVQIQNGNLHIEIPLWSIGGRNGLSVGLKMVYDSKGWHVSKFCPRNGECNGSVLKGTHSVLAIENPLDYRRVGGGPFDGTHETPCGSSPGSDVASLQEPDGTLHAFAPVHQVNGTSSICPSVGTVTYASDGSGWAYKSGVGYIKPDGTIILTGTSVTDSNGNKLTISTSSPQIITDTGGRQLSLDGSYKSSDGVQRNIQIATTTIPIQTNLCQYYTGTGVCTETTETWTVPHVITLPNGMQYTFEYEQNQYGEPNLVTLPTGGTISYTYGPPIQAGGRWVTSRTVNSGTSTDIWSYSYTYIPTVPGATNLRVGNVIVTDPAHNDTRTTFDSCTAPCKDMKVEYFQGPVSPNPIKTVFTAFISLPAGSFTSHLYLPSTETTTWNQQNLVSKVETDWDQFNS